MNYFCREYNSLDKVCHTSIMMIVLLIRVPIFKRARPEIHLMAGGGTQQKEHTQNLTNLSVLINFVSAANLA